MGHKFDQLSALGPSAAFAALRRARLS